MLVYIASHRGPVLCFFSDNVFNLISGCIFSFLAPIHFRVLKVQPVVFQKKKSTGCLANGTTASSLIIVLL